VPADLRHLTSGDRLQGWQEGREPLPLEGRHHVAEPLPLAAGLDPTLAKEFQAAGGNEDLDKAKQLELDIMKGLALARKQETDTSLALTAAMKDLAAWSAKVVRGTGAVEKTKSQIGGFPDPNLPPAGEPGGNPAPAGQGVKVDVGKVAKSGEHVADALMQLVDAVLARDAHAADAIREAAQRLKGAHR
jgi:hypothetical protein